MSVTSSELLLARQGILAPGDLGLVSSRTSDLLAELAPGEEKGVDAVRLTRLAESLIEDSQRLGERIRKTCLVGDIGAAIALFSPSYYRSLGQSGEDEMDSHIVRSGFKYLVRAALKPSPFGTLARVGVPGSVDSRIVSRVPVHALHAIVIALSTTAEFAPRFSYRRAEVHDGTVFLRRWREVRPGFAWPRESPIALDDVRSDITQLDLWTRGSWRSLMTSTGASEDRLLRWIHMGIVEVVPPWEETSAESPLVRLCRILDQDPKGVRLASLLRELDREVSALPSAGPPERAQIADEIARVERSIVHELGGAVSVRNSVSEDASFPLDGRSEAVSARSLFDPCRSHIFRSHAYQVVVDAFIAAHGIGGSAPNAREFFQQCARDSTTQGSILTARGEDALCTTESVPTALTHAKVGRTTAPPTVGVLYQIASSEEESLCVANQFADGLGGLAARYGELDRNDATGIRAGIRAWIQEVFGSGVHVREFVPGAEGNSAQYLSKGLLPGIRWRAAEAVAGEISFDDLVLMHDPGSDTLDFYHQDRLCAPVYTGLLPAWQLAGAQEIACLIMNPWVDRGPTSVASHPLLRVQLAQEHPHIPRRQVGALVSTRETWHVRSEEFPSRSRHVSDAHFLLGVERWRRGMGLPVEAFYLPLSTASEASGFAKPFWVHFQSIVALEVLEVEARGSDYLRFQEVLPARRPDVPTTEYLSFLRWERP